MDFWTILLLLILFILLAYLAYRVLYRHTIKGSYDSVCDKTSTYLDKFVNEPFTPELATSMESLCDDIMYDADKIADKQLTQDNTLSKLLLDTMLQYYIQTKRPNTISAAVIKENIKKIDKIKSSQRCVSEASLRKLIDYCENVIKDKNAVKMVYPSARELFRRANIYELTSGSNGLQKVSDEVDRLKDELSRKNVELRNITDELSRARRSDFRPSLSADILLEQCNRERRELYDKVYELRKDIERVRSGPAQSDMEVSALRQRIADLQLQNNTLSGQLQQIQSAHAGESMHINQLMSELSNCKSLLDQVLTAQTG